MTHYSTTFFSQPATSGNSRLRRGANTAVFTSDERKGLGPISNAIILAVLLCVMGLIYLTQITKTSSYGYDLNELEARKTRLVEENESLAVEAARLQALSRLNDTAAAEKLTKPSQTDFVNQ